MKPRDAMSAAVRLYTTPAASAAFSGGLFLPHLLDVIKAAAGDEQTLSEHAARHALDAQELREASRHYLIQQLSDPNMRGVQILGLNDGASETDMKHHKRWLLKWLHPDLNPSAWEQKLFHRINEFKPGEFKPGEFKPGTTTIAQMPVEQIKPPRSRSRRRERSVIMERRKTADAQTVFLRFVRPLVVCLTFVIVLASLGTAVGIFKLDPLTSMVSRAGN